jgi:glycosyltransferase involved in cell wall biosynthesis
MRAVTTIPETVPAGGFLFVHDEFAVRGGGEQVLLHAAALARKRARTDLALVWKRARSVAASELAVFDSVVDLDCPQRLRPRTFRAYWDAMSRLQATLRARAVRACVAFSFGGAFRATLATRRLGVPMAWVCQEDVQALWGTHALSRRRLAFRLINLARPRVVCLTESARTSFRRLGLRPDHLYLIPPAVDESRFEAERAPAEERRVLRQQQGIPEGDLAIVCVAHLHPIKNHRLLVQAVRLARDASLRVTLICVGDVIPGLESYAADLADHARRLDVQDRIRWVGMQADVRPWLAIADGAVLASKREACPLALIEAAACALPLVGAEVNGIRELVIPEVTGCSFPSGDARGCAQAFARLAASPGLRERLGRGARDYVRAHFNQKQSDERWDELFDELLTPGAAR